MGTTRRRRAVINVDFAHLDGVRFWRVAAQSSLVLIVAGLLVWLVFVDVWLMFYWCLLVLVVDRSVESGWTVADEGVEAVVRAVPSVHTSRFCTVVHVQVTQLACMTACSASELCFTSPASCAGALERAHAINARP